MSRNQEFETLISRISETGYEDVARIEAEARRLRAETVSLYIRQAFEWVTVRFGGNTSKMSSPRHA